MTKFNLDKLKLSVTGRYSYLDTVGAWIYRHLNESEKRILKALCAGGINYHAANRPDGVWLTSNGRHRKYAAHVQLNQPFAEAALYLESLFAALPPVKVNRLDVSLDIFTSSKQEATDLKHFFYSSLEKPWHRLSHLTGSHSPHIEDPTLYLGGRKNPRHIAIYSDRPNKFVARPCCHLEWKFKRSAVLTLGIDNLSDLTTFHHLDFWKKHLRLFEIDFIAAGKALAGIHLNTKSNIRQTESPKTKSWAALATEKFNAEAKKRQLRSDQIAIAQSLAIMRTIGINSPRRVLTQINSNAFLPSGLRLTPRGMMRSDYIAKVKNLKAPS